MSEETFQALQTAETSPGEFTRKLVRRRLDELPEGALLVRVRFSSLNYKDALSAAGRPGVTKRYPHTPGIDAAGEVVACSDGAFQPGAAVIVTGFDLGMNTAGGFGQYIRVPSAWALPLPDGLDLRESMLLGTAGLTAGLSVLKLQHEGLQRGDEVVVSGATGGVGSMAVQILHRAGYKVTAVTGKAEHHDWLRSLGAHEVIVRAALREGSDRPLGRERWAGAVDCVGGTHLAAILKTTRYGGVVTCCGLVESPELPINVFPFILRGVTLCGIDSVQAPLEQRRVVWERLAGRWKPQHLEAAADDCDLSGLEPRIDAMLAGQTCGRTVVHLDAG